MATSSYVSDQCLAQKNDTDNGVFFPTFQSIRQHGLLGGMRLHKETSLGIGLDFEICVDLMKKRTEDFLPNLTKAV